MSSIDCRGLVCLYNGVLDIDSCQCKCEPYASGETCENLDCSSLTDQCDYGTDKSLCTTYANVPSECPKFCGLCDQFDDMKKHYDGSIKSFAHFSKSSVFIQLIIVLCLVYVSWLNNKTTIYRYVHIKNRYHSEVYSSSSSSSSNPDMSSDCRNR